MNTFTFTGYLQDHTFLHKKVYTKQDQDQIKCNRKYNRVATTMYILYSTSFLSGEQYMFDCSLCVLLVSLHEALMEALEARQEVGENVHRGQDGHSEVVGSFHLSEA